jgi:hypothetical protein
VPLGGATLHQPAELPRLAILAEPRAGRHHRDQHPIRFQHAERVHHVIDVLRIGKGRVHHDAVEQPLLGEPRAGRRMD